MKGYEVGTLNLNDVLDSYRRGSLSNILDAYLGGTLDEYQAGTGGAAPYDIIKKSANSGSGGSSWLTPEQQEQAWDPSYQPGLAAPPGVSSGGDAAGAAARAATAGNLLGGGAGGNVSTAAPRPSGPGGAASTLSSTGAGLLDPGSDYMQRLLDESAEGIGKTGAAQERAAALRSARSGLGAGASPEMLETQGDIGRSTMSAIGDANAGLRLGGMGLGAQMLGQGMSGDISMRGQDINESLGLAGIASAEGMQKAGISSAEGMQKAGISSAEGMQKTGLAAQDTWQQLNANMNANELGNNAWLDEQALQLSYALSGLPPPSSGSSPFTGGFNANRQFSIGGG